MAVKPAAKELAQTMKKKNHQDDEVAQGGGRAAMVAENTMDVKALPPTQEDWCQAEIANHCT